MTRLYKSRSSGRVTRTNVSLKTTALCDDNLLLPVSGKLVGSAVVASKTVNSALDQNQSELGVLILPVSLKVLADSHSLLHQVVKILRDLGSESASLEEANESVSGDALDLGNTEGITENHTDLRWSVSLLGQLANLSVDLSGGCLVPGRSSSLVGDGGGRNSLS